MRSILLTLFLLFATTEAQAGQFSGLGGMVQSLNEKTNGSSYSWQMEYREKLTGYLSASFSYLNEGHTPAHHRDGNALQLWANHDVFDQHLSLSAGIGPYYYFDTIAKPGNGSYANGHDFGVILSMAAIWQTESPWTLQLRTNWVETMGSVDSMSILAGIGYQLDPSPRQSKGLDTPEPREVANNEITILAGRTITNSFNSEHSTSLAVEYRRALFRYLDMTVSWLYEGDTRLIRRDGLASQLWAVNSFQDGGITLGFGVGAYFAIDQQAGHRQNGDRNISAIATLTGSYRLNPHWSLRASWNRIITNYDRDTDVIMGGIGYRF